MHQRDEVRPRVRGLPVPDLLVDLLRAGAWQHPGDAALAEFMPWFTDPLEFLTSIQDMTRESRSLDRLVQDEATARVFRLARSSTATGHEELPWLAVDRAFLIAVARLAGDDTAVALDFRTGSSSPRVVVSDVWTDPQQCQWRVVAETFPAFTAGVQLTAG